MEGGIACKACDPMPKVFPPTSTGCLLRGHNPFAPDRAAQNCEWTPISSKSTTPRSEETVRWIGHCGNSGRLSGSTSIRDEEGAEPDRAGVDEDDLNHTIQEPAPSNDHQHFSGNNEIGAGNQGSTPWRTGWDRDHLNWRVITTSEIKWGRTKWAEWEWSGWMSRKGAHSGLIRAHRCKCSITRFADCRDEGKGDFWPIRKSCPPPSGSQHAIGSARANDTEQRHRWQQ